MIKQIAAQLTALLLTVSLSSCFKGEQKSERQDIDKDARKEVGIQVLSGEDLKASPPVPLYNIWRLHAAPQNNKTLGINPPRFQWKKDEAKGVRYKLEWSRDKTFKNRVKIRAIAK